MDIGWLDSVSGTEWTKNVRRCGVSSLLRSKLNTLLRGIARLLGSCTISVFRLLQVSWEFAMTKWGNCQSIPAEGCHPRTQSIPAFAGIQGNRRKESGSRVKHGMDIGWLDSVSGTEWTKNVRRCGVSSLLRSKLNNRLIGIALFHKQLELSVSLDCLWSSKPAARRGCPAQA